MINEEKARTKQRVYNKTQRDLRRENDKRREFLSQRERETETDRERKRETSSVKGECVPQVEVKTVGEL